MSSEFDDLALAIALSVSAGSAILRIRERGFDISEKSDLSPVTAADLASNQIIIEGLRTHRPKQGFLSEETVFTETKSSDLWVLDPLDGTKAFISGVRGFAVQLAKFTLNENGTYSIRMGVTYEPTHGELLFAARSLGTFSAEVAAEELSIESARNILAEASFIRPKRGDDSVELPASLNLIRSHTFEDTFKQALVTEGFKDAGALRSVGVKVGRLIENTQQVYVADHPLSWWDLAAPQAILECAGGRVTDLKGQPVVYSQQALQERRFTFESPLVFTRGLSHEQSRQRVLKAYEASR